MTQGRPLNSDSVASLKRLGSSLTSNANVVLLGRLGLWAAAFVTAFRGQHMLEDQQSMGRAAAYMGVAVLFIMAATWRQQIPEETAERSKGGTMAGISARARSAAFPLALALAALGLGIAFRTYRLTSAPPGVWFDEAQNGLIAREILHGHFPPIFIGGYSQLPSLYFYVLAGAFKVMGDDIVTIRSVSTMAGVLALPMVFLLAKELFGRRVGALAVFFLAVMRWHVNFSRFGVSNVWASFLALGAVYFLVRGLRGKGWWNLVAAGIFTGLGPYAGFYFTFIPAVMVVYWLHSAFSQRVLGLRNHVLAMAVVGVVALAVYSPVANWGLHHRDQLTARPNQVSIVSGKSRGDAVQAVLKSAKQHLLMFNSVGDGNPRHNIPGAPMLDTITGIFFILGIGISAAKVRRPEYVLLLAWLALVLQSGIWSDGAPQAFRTSALTPALAMLAALPLGAALSFVYDRRGAPDLWRPGEGSFRQRADGIVRADRVGYAARLLVGLSALFLLAQAARLNFDSYFNVQLHRSDVWAEYSMGPTIVGHEINQLRPEHYQFFISTTFVNEPTRLFLNGPETDDIVAFDMEKHIPVSDRRPTVFFLDGLEESKFLRLRSLYPDGVFTMHRAPAGGGTVLFEAILSADDIRSLMGIQAVYTDSSGQRVERLETQINADWATQAPLLPPLQAAWSGFIALPEYGQYVLGVRAPGHVRMVLDGEPFAEGDGTAEGRAVLFQGPHQIEIEADVSETGLVQLYWQQPGGQAAEPVPAPNLFSSPKVYWGLRVSFYSGLAFEGSPVLEGLEPFVAARYGGLPAGGPFSVRWKGKLLVPASGPYGLRLETIGDGKLLIDGRPILTSANEHHGEEPAVSLTAGAHDVEVLFSNGVGNAQVFLSWRPPGAEWVNIPPENFAPR